MRTTPTVPHPRWPGAKRSASEARVIREAQCQLPRPLQGKPAGARAGDADDLGRQIVSIAAEGIRRAFSDGGR